MSKRIGISILLVIASQLLLAQQKWNYTEVDKKSYELFQQQKWEELISFNNEVRDHGIDYFNLQARTGIAYYNLKKYRKSSKWFFEAWENDQQLEWMQEYLYYSLIFSGRSLEAFKMAENFTRPLQQKILYEKMKPLRFAVEAGYSFNPDINTLIDQNMDQKAGMGSQDYGEALFLKNYFFTSFDYSHQLAPGITLTHNFTYIRVNREEQVVWGNRYTDPFKINQFQYFLSPQFTLGRWYFAPSMNVIWGNYNIFLGDYDQNRFYITKNKYSDFIFSTSVWTNWGNISPGAEINLANIYNKGFTQASAWMTFYPLSNTNLYFTPRVYFKKDQENSFGYNTFGISGGFQLGQFHFYGNYLNGEMKNFIEYGGYVIANFPGRSTYKFSGSMYFPYGKRYQFVVRYNNQDVIEKYQVYTETVPTNSLEYKYIKHTITAGISWNF